MKKYIVLVLFLVFSIFLFGCSKKEELSDLEVIKQRGYLIVGVKDDSMPFGFYNKEKKLSGLDIDIAYEIALNIFKNPSKANVEFVIVNSQNRISMLNSKKVDMLVATMSINNKRKLVIDFSMPYFAANQKLMVRKTSKITNLQYFNKYGKLAVVMGTTAEKIARMVAPNSNLVGCKTYNEAYNLLMNHQVDGVFGDDCLLVGYLNKHLKIINRAYSREFYAVALRKSDKSKDLLNCVNCAIATLLDERKINLITKKWINY